MLNILKVPMGHSECTGKLQELIWYLKVFEFWSPKGDNWSGGSEVSGASKGDRALIVLQGIIRVFKSMCGFVLGYILLNALYWLWTQ